MKTILILCALTSAAFATKPILVRVTPEELAVRQQAKPLAKLQEPAKDQAKIVQPNEQSIVKQSAILHDGVNWTLVPKSAVIFLPTALKSRVDVKPVGTLLSWVDFLAKNRSWITTNEVSFDQAAGFVPLAAERVAFWAKQDKIVIATHQLGPISVRIAAANQTISQR
jgi:hypothetical protein